jgi:hypothetical protein
MASDYRAITEYNERQLGRDTASRKTQISMYSDPTHFIFEILQNADDYGAKEVLFKLSRRELVIEHDGKPFLEENVRAVTYFGKSTSRDDLVKTGRFGVGFKSVFAFTASPIIISGDERFRIHGLYRVEEYPYPADLPRKRTRITLPFNHRTEQPDYVDDHMEATDAYKMISKRLSGLNMNTLLFTQSIREIRWEALDKSGHYLREDKSVKGARQTSITNGEELVNYLVFSRAPSWKGQSHKNVEIAFLTDGKGQLIPIDEYLHVLFGTTQETHLKFIINGPYRTNPSRETISEEDAFNRHLLKETCELLHTALPSLRDRGLLTMNSLAAMPLQTDSLREFYVPILETAIECFRLDELVPTDKDTFASAAMVLQGPAVIREIVTDKELAFLSGKEGVLWAKGVTTGSRTDHFLKSLKIEQWGWEELEETLTEKFGGYRGYRWDYVTEGNAAWLEACSDQWLQKLYLLLAEGIRKDECSDVRLGSCAIIRSMVRRQIVHVRSSQTYFPKSRGFQDLPQVKKSLLAGKTKLLTKKIEDALVALGVRQIGEEERIDLILSTYYCEEGSDLSPEQHLEHMGAFIKTWKKDRDVSKFEDEAIFKVIGDGSLHAAADCFIDSPLQNSGLNVIYKEDHDGIPHKQKLWSRYQAIRDEGFCDFAIACGVLNRLAIVKQNCNHHPNQSFLRQDYNQYGVKYTSTAINKDYTIIGLKNLLRLQDLQVNKLIWDAVRSADPEVLEAVFRPNRQYNTREDKSSLVILLSKAEWIPDKKGRLQKPSVMRKADVHPSFRYDNRNGWLDAIGFGEADKKASEEFQRKKELAKQAGIPVALIELLSSIPKEKQPEYFEMLKKKRRADAKQQATQENALEFHEAIKGVFTQGGGPQLEHDDVGGRTSKNPGRRKMKLSEQISEDIEGSASAEERITFGLSKRWKAKNDQVKARLTSWYGGRCQICNRTFTQRNNQPYFEGLYLVPYTKAAWIDRVGNVLCLCPWHSAMFQFGSKEIEGDILDGILGFVPKESGGCGDAEIRLKLCGEPVTIGFHEDHFLELQTMVEESGGSCR